jgi:pyruvate,water dikinase
MVLTELGHAATRHQLSEIGRRLVRRGRLDDEWDAIQLEPDELEAALLRNLDLRGTVDERKQRRRSAEAAVPAATVGATQPDVVRSAELIDSIYLEAIEMTSEDSDRDESDGSLHGLPASRGQYSGRAIVCRSIDDAGRLRAGDVLVCRTTSPAWTQYFALIGGIVTEQGGVLSHPAVVAREYGVPAVLAVPQVTSIVSNGDLIELDGGTGTVRIRRSPAGEREMT